MKLIFAVIAFVLPVSASALSVRNGCGDFWPEGIESGHVDMTYSVNARCETTDIQFNTSRPEGAFEELAKCYINRSIPVGYPGTDLNLEPISESEYEDMLEQFRNSHPDKHHQRSILVENGAGEEVALTCYFTEEWSLSGHAVQNSAGSTDVDPEYVRRLPRQRFKATFESEL